MENVTFFLGFAIRHSPFAILQNLPIFVTFFKSSLPIMQKRLTDQEIVEALRAGGAVADVALRQVYFAHRAAIRSLVLKNSGTAEEARDVFQETVIAFFENVRDGKFRGESAIGSYLWAMARFNWLNRLKRKGIEAKALGQLPGMEVEHGHLPRMVEEETRQQLLGLVKQLGEDCQKMLIATIYQNQSMEKAAKELGYRNAQVARNKKYLCLKKLKNILKKNPGLLKRAL